MNGNVRERERDDFFFLPYDQIQNEGNRTTMTIMWIETIFFRWDHQPPHLKNSSTVRMEQRRRLVLHQGSSTQWPLPPVIHHHQLMPNRGKW